MPNTKTAAAPVAEKRLSKLERLQRELAQAKAEQQDRVLKKVNGLQAQLTAAESTRDKAIERVAKITAELNAVKGELPLITDGVGEKEITEDDLAQFTAPVVEDEAPAETEPAKA